MWGQRHSSDFMFPVGGSPYHFSFRSQRDDRVSHTSILAQGPPCNQRWAGGKF